MERKIDPVGVNSSDKSISDEVHAFSLEVNRTRQESPPSSETTVLQSPFEIASRPTAVALADKVIQRYFQPRNMFRVSFYTSNNGFRTDSLLKLNDDLPRDCTVVAPLEICMETLEPEYSSGATYLTQPERIRPSMRTKLEDVSRLLESGTTWKPLPRPLLLQYPLEITFEICRYVCGPQSCPLDYDSNVLSASSGRLEEF